MASDEQTRADCAIDGGIRSHRDLRAWQAAYALGLAVYKASAGFPDAERYGLTSQARRCAVSIASNIAEGYGRGAAPDYLRFLRIARGSIRELDTQLLFARDLGYLNDALADELASRVCDAEMLLAGLIRSIERRLRG